MVNLTRIYTRTGDRGTTNLGDMSRVAKTDPRISAYADANEANAAIGTAIALGGLDEEIVKVLTRVQNDLFDVGADLSTPVAENPEFPPLRVSSSTSTSWRRTATTSTNSWRSSAPSSSPAAPPARPSSTRRARWSAAPNARPGRPWRPTNRS